MSNRNLKPKKTLNNPLEGPLKLTNHENKTIEEKSNEENELTENKQNEEANFNKEISIIDNYNKLNNSFTSQKNHLITNIFSSYSPQTKIINADKHFEVHNNVTKIKQYFKIPDIEEMINIEMVNISFYFNNEIIISKRNALFGYTEYRAFCYLDSIPVVELKDSFLHFPLVYVKKMTNEMHLDLYFCDMRAYKIKFDNIIKLNKVFNDFLKYIFPSNHNNIYAFRYFKKNYAHNHHKSKEIVQDYNIHDELVRQEFYGPLDFHNKKESSFNKTHFLCLINENYSLSITYPYALVLALSMEEKQLVEVAKCFQLCRLPVLAWFNKSKKSSLWVSGCFKGTYSSVVGKYVEEYISSIDNNNKLRIFDTQKPNTKVKIQEVNISFLKEENVSYLDLTDYNKIKAKYSKIYSLEKDIVINKTVYSSLEKWLVQISILLRAVYDISGIIKVGYITNYNIL